VSVNPGSQLARCHAVGDMLGVAHRGNAAQANPRAHRSGGEVDAALAAQVPDVVDGARGVKLVAAAVESSGAGGAWTPARFAA